MKKKNAYDWKDTSEMLQDMINAFDTEDQDNSTEAKKNPARPRADDDMAQRIMDALCEDGRGDLLLLKDDNIREWWAGVTQERERKKRREAAARRRTELREQALRKLTAEERTALGIKS